LLFFSIMPPQPQFVFMHFILMHLVLMSVVKSVRKTLVPFNKKICAV